MPKNRRTTKLHTRLDPLKNNIHKQLAPIHKNNIHSLTQPNQNEQLLRIIKLEVKEEDSSDQLELNSGIKIEEFENLDFHSIKEEPTVDEQSLRNNELNFLIEWALNLQFDHSKKCKGRLYPCKETYDNFSCKIVVLYCTVCKKRMLHTLKDWAMM